MRSESLPEYQNPNIRRYFRDVTKTDVLTPEEEIELATRIRQGDPEARDHMIRANLRLVGEIAKEFMGRGVQLADLLQEGNLGLMEAVDRFDPSLGKLSTYAAWWINNYMHRAIAEQGRDISLPVSMLNKVNRVRHISMGLIEDLGREPTVGEISDTLGIPRKKIAAIMDAGMTPVSLQAMMQSQGDGDGESDADMGREYTIAVVDEKNESPFDQLVTDDLLGKTNLLLSWLGTRDQRKREIIELRYGLSGQKPQTLEEVGMHFRLTRERVRQLEIQALRMIRGRLRKLEDPNLSQARDLKPQSTPKSILDTPIGLNITANQRVGLLARLEQLNHVYAYLTRTRVAILIDKLIGSPKLTPREFEASLKKEELRHFMVQDIPSVVMPDRSTYQCLASILEQ